MRAIVNAAILSLAIIGLISLFLLGFVGLSHGICLLTVFKAPLIQWFLFAGGVSLLLWVILKGIDIIGRSIRPDLQQP